MVARGPIAAPAGEDGRADRPMMPAERLERLRRASAHFTKRQWRIFRRRPGWIGGVAREAADTNDAVIFIIPGGEFAIIERPVRRRTAVGAGTDGYRPGGPGRTLAGITNREDESFEDGGGPPPQRPGSSATGAPPMDSGDR